MKLTATAVYTAFAVNFILATGLSETLGNSSLSLDDPSFAVLLLGSSRVGYNSSPPTLNATVQSALQAATEDPATEDPVNYTLLVSDVVDTKVSSMEVHELGFNFLCLRD